MASDSVNSLPSEDLSTLCRLGVVGNLTDGQLLESFLAGNKETAEASFTALVDRHGPMVLRVCTQILGNVDDAQDAFQATFLVLVRRAGSVRKHDSVASWLYGIALRVARRARADAIRRQIHERRSAATAREQDMTPEVEPGCSWPDLHDELGRLPEKYRESVVLCYLQGLSTQAAAQRLGCPQGTVLSRLSRAREQLRKRLTRRGLTLPAGLLAAGLATETATAAVPPALARVVIQAAVASTLHKAAGSAAISATAAELTRGVLRTMFFTKLWGAAGAILTVTALATAAGALLAKTSARGPEPTEVAAQPAATAQPPKDLSKYPALRDSNAVPKDLTWTLVPPGERVRVLEMLAARSKANYEKIKTWSGSYHYLYREQLDAKFLASLPAMRGKVEPLIYEHDFHVDFAVDTALGSIYRETTTRKSRYFKVASNEPAEGPGSIADARSIVTSNEYLVFSRDYSIPSFVPGPPGKRNRHYAVSRPVKEARDELFRTDPREFYLENSAVLYAPGREDGLWSRADGEATILRGEAGEFGKTLTISQAEGPGGLWYWEQNGKPGPGELYNIRVWSPQAGYNPVLDYSSYDKPDGRLGHRIEWQWTRFDDTYLPAAYKQISFLDDGTLSTQCDATLEECALNKPLRPHQFDYEGLGLVDGDEIHSLEGGDDYLITNGQLQKIKGPAR